MNNISIGYVLIICADDSLEEVVTELQKIESVSEISVVGGPWNLIVKLETQNLDNIREAIRWRIRKMFGIESTLTLVSNMT